MKTLAALLFVSVADAFILPLQTPASALGSFNGDNQGYAEPQDGDYGYFPYEGGAPSDGSWERPPGNYRPTQYEASSEGGSDQTSFMNSPLRRDATGQGRGRPAIGSMQADPFTDRSNLEARQRQRTTPLIRPRSYEPQSMQANMELHPPIRPESHVPETNRFSEAGTSAVQAREYRQYERRENYALGGEYRNYESRAQETRPKVGSQWNFFGNKKNGQQNPQRQPSNQWRQGNQGPNRQAAGMNNQRQPRTQLGQGSNNFLKQPIPRGPPPHQQQSYTPRRPEGPSNTFLKQPIPRGQSFTPSPPKEKNSFLKQPIPLGQNQNSQQQQQQQPPKNAWQPPRQQPPRSNQQPFNGQQRNSYPNGVQTDPLANEQETAQDKISNFFQNMKNQQSFNPQNDRQRKQEYGRVYGDGDQAVMGNPITPNRNMRPPPIQTPTDQFGVGNRPMPPNRNQWLVDRDPPSNQQTNEAMRRINIDPLERTRNSMDNDVIPYYEGNGPPMQY